MNLTQLLKKYPQFKDYMYNDPKPDCYWCHGKGECDTEHGVLPCTCVFRDHNTVKSEDPK
jgi:hypothetical protein